MKSVAFSTFALWLAFVAGVAFAVGWYLACLLAVMGAFAVHGVAMEALVETFEADVREANDRLAALLPMEAHHG